RLRMDFANSAGSSLRGNRWPYTSSVIVIDECPSSACTDFGGNSRPPSALGLMHQEAKKWRKECRPYLFRMPAPSITDRKRPRKTLGCMGLPLPAGNTRSLSKLLHLSFHCFRASPAVARSSGTDRRLPSDLGSPISR